MVYDSFADVPLDSEPAYEGNDSIPLDERARARGLFSVRSIAAPPKQPDVYHLVVPYPGLLHEGSIGTEVHGVKRVVHRFSGTLPVLKASLPRERVRWGPFFTQKLKGAQRRARVPVTGVWDKQTHKALAPWADSYAIALLTPPKPTKEEIQRDAVLSFLAAFYNRRYNIAYDQARPTQLLPVNRITRADCSGSVATAMWTAGVLPHVDWHWTNTDVQIMLGDAVFGLEHVAAGDVALYGHGHDPSHESCVVSTKAGDVRVFSFGSYPARVLPIDYNRGNLGGRIALRRFIT